jgi:hypothetical protein
VGFKDGELLIINEQKIIVDANTGEIEGVLPSGTTFETPDQKKSRHEILDAKSQQKFFVRSECGKFFWSLYQPEEKYFGEVSDSMLSRIVYLMTYLAYDKNYLVVRDDCSAPYRPMCKEDVQKVIGLSARRFGDFWSDLMATQIISEQPDGKLVVCDKFRRGKLGKKAKRNMSAIKIFDSCVRYIYEHTTTKSHRYLAYLYRLIPYINTSYNVFCSNPEETRRDKIRWMTAKEMCWVLGLDDSNESRVISTLFKLTFVDVNGDERSVITRVQNYKNGENRNFIVINPQFYQGYNVSPQEAAALVKEFMLEKNTNAEFERGDESARLD